MRFVTKTASSTTSRRTSAPTPPTCAISRKSGRTRPHREESKEGSEKRRQVGPGLGEERGRGGEKGSEASCETGFRHACGGEEGRDEDNSQDAGENGRERGRKEGDTQAPGEKDREMGSVAPFARRACSTFLKVTPQADSRRVSTRRRDTFAPDRRTRRGDES